MSITEFQGVADIGEQFGNPKSAISSHSSHAPKWWRLQLEMKNPTYWICPECGENVPTRRQVCSTIYCLGKRPPEGKCVRVQNKPSAIPVTLLQRLASESLDVS